MINWRTIKKFKINMKKLITFLSFLFISLIVNSNGLTINDPEVFFRDNLENYILNYKTQLGTDPNKPGNIVFTSSQNEPYVPDGMSKEVDLHLKRIAVYDVGSSGIKFLLADVDPVKKRIVKEIICEKIDTKKRPNVGEDVTKANALERLAIMAGIKALIDEYFPHPNGVQHYGIATGGFRIADQKLDGLGTLLAKEINDTVGIQFKVATPEEEGEIGYYSAVYLVGTDFDSSKDIVWDIGGTTSQITYHQDNLSQFFGIDMGATLFFNEVMWNTKYLNPKTNTVNPLTNDEISESILLANFLISDPVSPQKPFSTLDIENIKNRVKLGGKVYGIGAVHNLNVYPAIRNYFHVNRPFYTKLEVNDITNAFIGKSDQEILDDIYKKKEKLYFIKNNTTAIILVYAMMDTLGIDEVYPITVSNQLGLIMKALMEETLCQTSASNSRSLF